MVNGTSNDVNGNVKHELNYVTTNRFYVEIGGSIAASFTECSGLGVQIQKDTYFEGGVNNQQRIFLGHAEFEDVTLKHGITDDLIFWSWLCEIFQKQETSRRNVNIIVFNQAGEIMKSWTLIGAIPVAWKSSALEADGNVVAIEELTLAFEGLNVGKKAGGGNSTKRAKTGFFSSS
ncbi:MAG: phage tail protein [Rhizonema sp. PD37]|nr:phage tail protein [Rhizonema sp. PD37]